MKKLILAVFIFLAGVPAFAADKARESVYDRVMRTGTLRCGFMLWPPYFDVDPNTGAVKGVGADLYRAVADLLDIKVEYKEIVVGQQVQEMEQGKVDAVCNDGPWVFSSMKFVDYSDPVYFSPVYLYVREDENRFATPESLNAKDVRFTGMDGDVSVTLVQRLYPEAALMTLPATADAASLMMNVTTGKADALIIDPAAANSFNATNKPGIRALFTDSPVVYPVGLSTRKGEQALLNMLNAGIQALWNTNAGGPILKAYDPDGMLFLPPAKPYGRAQ